MIDSTNTAWEVVGTADSDVNQYVLFHLCITEKKPPKLFCDQGDNSIIMFFMALYFRKEEKALLLTFEGSTSVILAPHASKQVPWNVVRV